MIRVGFVMEMKGTDLSKFIYAYEQVSGLTLWVAIILLSPQLENLCNSIACKWPWNKEEVK